MPNIEVSLELKRNIIKAFQAHKEDVLKDFRQEERTRLDQTASGDMDNKHIDSKTEETLNEMDFLTRSMEVLEKEIDILRSIPTQSPSSRVEFGSLVKTDKLIALIGAANERTDLDGVSVVGMSMAAPLTRAMEGKTVGDSVQLGTITHKIEEIC